MTWTMVDDDFCLFIVVVKKAKHGFSLNVDDSMAVTVQACRPQNHHSCIQPTKHPLFYTIKPVSPPRHDQSQTSYHQSLHMGFEHSKTLQQTHSTCRPQNWDDHSEMHALPCAVVTVLNEYYHSVVVCVLYDVCARQYLLFNVPSRYFRDIFHSFHSSSFTNPNERYQADAAN
jgi:hypothetical protein